MSTLAFVRMHGSLLSFMEVLLGLSIIVIVIYFGKLLLQS